MILGSVITNYIFRAFKLTLPHLWPATIKTTNLKNLSVKGQSSKLAPVLQGTSFTHKSTKKSELFPVQRYISPALEGEARRGEARLREGHTRLAAAHYTTPYQNSAALLSTLLTRGGSHATHYSWIALLLRNLTNRPLLILTMAVCERGYIGQNPSPGHTVFLSVRVDSYIKASKLLKVNRSS